jgi:hypothetical protein
MRKNFESENIDLKTLKGVQVSSTSKHKQVVFEMPSVCLSVCMCVSLASERLGGFYLHSECKSYLC